MNQYGINDFNLEDFELVTIMDIIDEERVEKTWDIEVEEKHHFFVRNPKNNIDEIIVSHNTAEIVFGDPEDEEYLDLKNYKVNPSRETFGWTSNNSIFAKLGMDYSNVCKRIKYNGEPGIAWLDNMKAYSRMRNGKDWKDIRVQGGNPCLSGKTKISTVEGLYRIDELSKRWKTTGYVPHIFTYNENTHKVELDTVIFVKRTKQNASVIKLTLNDDTELILTPDHKVYTNNRGWVIANDLTFDDIILKISNVPYTEGVTVKENKIKKINTEKNEDVYDIQMKTHHNFFANGILVHNCLEQSLESYELCCLVETFPTNHTSLDDYLRTLKYAYLYAKTVTLGKTHWPDTNRVMLRNRRIGTSMSGIAQFITQRGIHELKNWCTKGYAELQKWDKMYSDWLAVPRSIKLSSVKPSGCLTPNTKVKTNGGIKSLYNIFSENGIDLDTKLTESNVWYDPITDIYVYDSNNKLQKISKLYINGKSSVIKLTFDDGTSVQCTPKHKFMFFNQRWVSASDIQVGDAILSHNNSLIKIKSKEMVNDFIFTVDIEVENTHNYQLENGIFSHNTVSLLVGSTPGMHYPESRFYIRRMRLSNHSKLITPLKNAGYTIEPAFGAEDSTVVVEIPVDVGENIRTVNDLSLWEQLSLAAFMQKYWADNQVSATITFNPKTEGNQISEALNYFQYQLKGISFLPKLEGGAYKQMPYEEIDEDTYNKLKSKLKTLNFNHIKGEKANVEKFCDSTSCELEYEPLVETKNS